MRLSGPSAKSPSHVIEDAYRRGYCQAVSMLLLAIDNGATDWELRDWLTELRDWRDERHQGAFDPPADPPGLQKGVA